MVEELKVEVGSRVDKAEVFWLTRLGVCDSGVTVNIYVVESISKQFNTLNSLSILHI